MGLQVPVEVHISGMNNARINNARGWSSRETGVTSIVIIPYTKGSGEICCNGRGWCNVSVVTVTRSGTVVIGLPSTRHGVRVVVLLFVNSYYSSRAVLVLW